MDSIYQVLGWDSLGAIKFYDVMCGTNTASGSSGFGGCFYGAGKGIFHDETAMLGNRAAYGGCICEHASSAS